MRDLEDYLIQKAWEIRRTGDFMDLDTAKAIWNGEIKESEAEAYEKGKKSKK